MQDVKWVRFVCRDCGRRISTMFFSPDRVPIQQQYDEIVSAYRFHVSEHAGYDKNGVYIIEGYCEHCYARKAQNQFIII